MQITFIKLYVGWLSRGKEEKKNIYTILNFSDFSRERIILYNPVVNYQTVCGDIGGKVTLGFDFDPQIDARCFGIIVLSRTIYTDKTGPPSSLYFSLVKYG